MSYYIILHKQFVYCNHRGRGSQREEEEDRALFNFNRLGKGGHYARDPGNASVKVWVRLRLVLTFKWVLRLKQRFWHFRDKTRAEDKEG